MGLNSNIAWTDHTWNPWTGCKKVSAGCKYCYMYRDQERFGKDPTDVIKSAESTFNKPMHWPAGSKVFTCSWSDFFIEQADKWRPQAWNIIRARQDITFQILTKRPERIRACLPADWKEGYPNVWLGVSAENQDMLDLRVPILCQVPAAVRWLSIEPIIGKVDLNKIVWQPSFGADTGFDGFGQFFINTHLAKPFITDEMRKIGWVVVGGESGRGSGPEQEGVKYGYRAAEIQWFYDITGQCRKAKVPVFVKQLGTHLAKQMGLGNTDGKEPLQWPQDLNIQEFPKEMKQMDKQVN